VFTESLPSSGCPIVDSELRECVYRAVARNWVDMSQYEDRNLVKAGGFLYEYVPLPSIGPNEGCAGKYDPFRQKSPLMQLLYL
jgi:hypothetical protein